MRKVILGTTLLIALISAGDASAQGTVRGAAEGAEAGGRAAGPPGAVVGGAVGAVTGTIGGILGVDDRPRFREYVVREQRPSYRHHEEVRVGTVLPDSGVTYYDVPRRIPRFGISLHHRERSAGFGRTTFSTRRGRD